MNDLQRAFRTIHGRDISTAERQEIERLLAALGLDSSDAMALVIILNNHLYERIERASDASAKLIDSRVAEGEVKLVERVAERLVQVVDRGQRARVESEVKWRTAVSAAVQTVLLALAWTMGWIHAADRSNPPWIGESLSDYPLTLQLIYSALAAPAGWILGVVLLLLTAPRVWRHVWDNVGSGEQLKAGGLATVYAVAVALYLYALWPAL